MLKRPAKILLAILLTTGVSALLSGCLVEQKDPADIETISRNGVSNWRIYQAGDWIEYNVQEVDSNGVLTLSTWKVQWTLPTSDIRDPILDISIINPPAPAPSVPVLKETTTVYDSDGDEVNTIIRYVSQDANGVITLHAIDDGTGILYWPFFNATVEEISTPILFDSPIVSNTTPVNSGNIFHVMECIASSCSNEIYTYRDDAIEVKDDSVSVETPLGIFSDPFKITFDGGINKKSSPTLEFLGDLRDLCGTSNDIITHGISAGSGTFYVFPEIGIIKIENACQVSGDDTIFYTATLRDTNIIY